MSPVPNYLVNALGTLTRVTPLCPLQGKNQPLAALIDALQANGGLSSSSCYLNHPSPLLLS